MAIFGFGKKKEDPTLSQLEAAAPVAPAKGMAAVKLAAAPHYAPGTEIGYHPDLIGRFQQTHEALQKLYVSVKTQAENNEFAAAQKTLDAFRKALTGHLLEENVKLYTYLAKCLESDPDNKDLMVSMKSEMGKIGSTVMAFIKEYSNSGITPFNKKAFLEGWDGIGATLVDRIEREETSLYTMYMPPSAFQ